MKMQSTREQRFQEREYRKDHPKKVDVSKLQIYKDLSKDQTQMVLDGGQIIWEVVDENQRSVFSHYSYSKVLAEAEKLFSTGIYCYVSKYVKE